ncbi:MAG: DUF2066 domain-containing protein, partial [Rhodospirillaceae bacterium]
KEDAARLPEPGSVDVTDYVRDFAVSDEKTSAVRYLAKLNVRFKAGPVRELLRSQGIRFAETVSKPVLMQQVFQDSTGPLRREEANVWRRAWNLRRADDGLVRLALPLADISALNVEQAVRGDVDRLTGLAVRYNAGDTIVSFARLGLAPDTGLQRVEVSSTRFSSRHEPVTDLISVPQETGESEPELLLRAADAVAMRLEEDWKIENLLVHDGQGVSAVTVPISSLKDWLDVKRRLGNVSVVRRLDLVLLSLDEVRINLHYVGAPEQLQTALGQADLALVREDDEWVLYPAGVVPPGKS